MAARDIFGIEVEEGNFVRYAVELQILDQMSGGVPKSPDTIKQWLKSRLELGDRALVEMTREIAEQMEEDTGTRPSADELLDEVVAKEGAGNGFVRVNGILQWEGRCMKAALKEAANIAYPGVEFPGKPKGIKKGLMRYLNERVFVPERYISLGVPEATRTETRVKHLMTPQGPRSALNVVDVVEKPLLSFHIDVLDDFIERKVWGRLWEILEEIGVDADRARGEGRFELVRFEKV